MGYAPYFYGLRQVGGHGVNSEAIVRLLATLGAEYVQPGKNNIQFTCLLARWTHSKGSDSRPSMGVLIGSASKVHCFACGWSGPLHALVSLLAYFRDDSKLDALAESLQADEDDLLDLLGAIPGYEGSRLAYSDVLLPEVVLEPFAGRTHRYILDRGITIETLRAWDCGFDRRLRRATFPVRTVLGHLVGIVGRAVDRGVMPKYFDYFRFKKSQYLFGAHMVTPETDLIVVEGCMDALAVWQEVHPRLSVVALLGCEASARQRDLLVSLCDRTLVLFLDDDPAGRKGSANLAQALSGRLRVLRAEYLAPPGADPAILAQYQQVVPALATARVVAPVDKTRGLMYSDRAFDERSTQTRRRHI